jgi:hypothetical protein
VKRKPAEYLYYLAPMLFCLAVHWMAIKTWFAVDDFAWLGLHLELHPNLHDWLDVLFGPRAQGTIRTLSERVFFLVFTSIFGLNALPFRLWMFLTQFVDIVLLMAIARRLTGSRWAALIAAFLWSANAGLAGALSWTSAYNETCCAFFLLAAFYCLLRFIETGERKFWILQWTAFLLAFGALELIVTYPALAALYTWLFARRYFRRTLWLFIPSALFTAFHFLYVPPAQDAAYRMRFDAGMLTILWKYFAFAAAASRPEVLDWRPVWLGVSLALAIAAGVAFALIRNTRLALFCVGWFVIVLLPVLPLTNHFTEYYLTMPALGLAILGGWILVTYPRIAATVGVLYLAVSITDVHVAGKYNYERARRMKKLVLGLEENRETWEGKVVLLSGVDNDTFWSGFYDDPFRLLGLREIYLTPGSEKAIQPHPEWGGIDRFLVTVDSVVDLGDRLVVFAVHPNGIEDVTSQYRVVALSQYAASHRDKVDVGRMIYAKRLGPGWYVADRGYRWMGKSASVELSGPGSPGKQLFVSGFCPAVVLEHGPVELAVRIDGRLLGSVPVDHPGQNFEFQFPLPAEAIGQETIHVSVEVSRTIKIPPDERDLGLIFGTFTIK